LTKITIDMLKTAGSSFTWAGWSHSWSTVHKLRVHKLFVVQKCTVIIIPTGINICQRYHLL